MRFRRLLRGGADDEIRTRDLSITNRLHYHCATSAMRGKVATERLRCQCDFWLLLDFAFDAEVGADAAVGGVVEVEGGFVGWHAVAAQCGCGASEEDGGDVENDAVDQATVEGFAEGFAAAFDEDMLDSAFAEVLEDGGEGLAFVDDGAVAVFVGEQVAIAWDLARARPDGAEGLFFDAQAADGELRVVGADGFGSHEHGAAFGAEAHGVTACGLGGDPSPVGWRGDAGIETHACLGGDEGEAGGDPFVPGAVEERAFLAEDAEECLDAGLFEDFFGATGVLGVRVGGSEDNAGESGLDDGLRAGRRAAVCGAGFQRDMERCAASKGGIFQVPESIDFGMGFTGSAMPAEREDFSIFGNDGSHCGIGAGFSLAFARLGECRAHEGVIPDGLASGAHGRLAWGEETSWRLLPRAVPTLFR